MESLFSASFFAGNRERLRQLFTGTAPIIVTANGLLQRGGDSTMPFAQDAVFWYLTGIDEPDIVLVMDKGREYLIVPARSDTRETFDGAVAYSALKRRSGIKDIYDDKEGWEKLGGRLKKVKHAASLASPGSYLAGYGFYTNPARAALLDRLKSQNKALELLDLGAHLVRMRTVKQPPEVMAIQKAIDITGASIKELARPVNISKYTYEFQIEAELTRGMRYRGAHHSFEPIVAGGKRACTLHNVSNEGALGRRDLVIIDTGAEVEHYAADITRTIHLSTPTKRQVAVHRAVAEVQQYAFGLIRPGIMLRDYEQQVETYMGEKLRELGLIKSISHDNVRKYFPHATSHFLGLNVHDTGDYGSPLLEGSVITVEPGIYIPEEGIGVRIEDDVLVTAEGIKNLSGKLPTSIDLH